MLTFAPEINSEVWVSGRYQHIANVPSRKAPRVRILLLPQKDGGLAELVYCTGLENRQTETSQGFESLSLR